MANKKSCNWYNLKQFYTILWVLDHLKSKIFLNLCQFQTFPAHPDDKHSAHSSHEIYRNEEKWPFTAENHDQFEGCHVMSGSKADQQIIWRMNHAIEIKISFTKPKKMRHRERPEIAESTGSWRSRVKRFTKAEWQFITIRDETAHEERAQEICNLTAFWQ